MKHKGYLVSSDQKRFEVEVAVGGRVARGRAFTVRPNRLLIVNQDKFLNQPWTLELADGSSHELQFSSLACTCVEATTTMQVERIDGVSSSLS